VTIPLKAEVRPLCDELCDVRSEGASEMGGENHAAGKQRARLDKLTTPN
jgi:hypothetical protein